MMKAFSLINYWQAANDGSIYIEGSTRFNDFITILKMYHLCLLKYQNFKSNGFFELLQNSYCLFVKQLVAHSNIDGLVSTGVNKILWRLRGEQGLTEIYVEDEFKLQQAESIAEKKLSTFIVNLIPQLEPVYWRKCNHLDPILHLKGELHVINSMKNEPTPTLAMDLSSSKTLARLDTHTNKELFKKTVSRSIIHMPISSRPKLGFS
jgi:hypothetical protein